VSAGHGSTQYIQSFSTSGLYVGAGWVRAWGGGKRGHLLVRKARADFARPGALVRVGDWRRDGPEWRVPPADHQTAGQL